MRQLTIDGRQEDIPERHERMKLFDAPRTMKGQLPMELEESMPRLTVAEANAEIRSMILQADEERCSSCARPATSTEPGLCVRCAIDPPCGKCAGRGYVDKRVAGMPVRVNCTACR